MSRTNEGHRALPRITLTAEVVHDGSPTALVGHLQVEGDDVLERWGCDVLGRGTMTKVVLAGDAESAARPVRGEGA